MRDKDPLPENAATILINLAAELSSAADGDGRWEVANNAISLLGGKSLLIGAFKGKNLLPEWSRANMDADWIKAYQAHKLYEADLVLLNRQRGTLPMFHRAGMTVAGNGISQQSVDWCQGLYDAGYGGHIVRGFDSQFGRAQTLVSILPSVEAGDAPFQIDSGLITGIAALISAYICPPTKGDIAGKLSAGYQELSGREREVVSLLAEGLTTARIAASLGLAEVTVHKHFRGARLKMGASNREQTLALAMVRNQINV